MYSSNPLPCFSTPPSPSHDFSVALGFAVQADEAFDLYNNAPCGYHSLDADGRVLRINNTELQWLGYTRDAVVGRLHFSELVASDSRESFAHCLLDLERHGVVRDCGLQLQRADGSRFDVSLGAVVVQDDSGEPLMSRFTVFDITAQKAAEGRMRDRERFLERVLGALPAVVYVFDVHNQCNVFASHEIAAQLGYTGEPVEAMDTAFLDTLLHPDDVPEIMAHRARVLGSTDRHIHHTTARLRHVSGGFRVWAFRETAFERDPHTHKVTRYLGVAQDVTDSSK